MDVKERIEWQKSMGGFPTQLMPTILENLNVDFLVKNQNNVGINILICQSHDLK